MCWMRCSQGTWLEVGKAMCSSKRAHTNTKFASFFIQARILTGHKSQTLNHCTVDLQVAYKESSFSSSLPPCLLSLHHTHEIFLLVLFHLISQTSFTQPVYTHPRHVGSEGCLTAAACCSWALCKWTAGWWRGDPVQSRDPCKEPA